MTSLTYDEAAEVRAVRTERHGEAQPAEAPVAGCVRRQQCEQQVRGRRQHHDGKATESVAKQMHIKVEVILRGQNGRCEHVFFVKISSVFRHRTCRK